ncbi:MAG: hypothetical protein ABIC91_05890 [Nanoarchaeota archaeon]|nr:hypothetical protein [Nanoarchaeota archaeon]MBU1030980.1 hypothetical protein [Nanoarchaeota archaeon]MBU1849891.1 hypothetical protein [Nanoarchaeota archaeon]
MYSWGVDTSDWRGSGSYKYDSARSPYLDKLATDSSKKGPRTYNTGSSPDMKLVNTRGKTIKSDSENPIVVAIDVTGSMASWPKEIFDRLPLFYQTLSQYKPDLEISFAAIGDAYCDSYPIQVNDFGKGVKLEDHLKALYPEGGGGGQSSESYELFAYYMLNHCETPKAKNPFLFIYGDENFYSEINNKQVEHYIGDKLQTTLKSSDVWQKLLQKFNVYHLHKPYGGISDGQDKSIKASWAKAIGSQKIIDLPSYDRAVDIAMGVVAKHWGEFGDFKSNLSARQNDPTVRKSVYDSLRFIHDDLSDKSVVTGKINSVTTASLTGGADDK